MKKTKKTLSSLIFSRIGLFFRCFLPFFAVLILGALFCRFAAAVYWGNEAQLETVTGEVTAFREDTRRTYGRHSSNMPVYILTVDGREYEIPKPLFPYFENEAFAEAYPNNTVTLRYIEPMFTPPRICELADCETVYLSLEDVDTYDRGQRRILYILLLVICLVFLPLCTLNFILKMKNLPSIGKFLRKKRRKQTRNHDTQ